MTQLADYRITTKLGRLSNGAERDHGTVAHAVPKGSWKALCGTEPGKRSVGWSEYQEPAVTCPKCLKRLYTKAVNPAEAG